jgi:hypothetical protein
MRVNFTILAIIIVGFFSLLGSCSAPPEDFATEPEPPAPPISEPTASDQTQDNLIEPYPAWPPERPSTSVTIPASKLAEEGRTLRDLSKRFEDSLVEARQPSPSYYSVPGGFALLTQIQQIDAEGNILSNGVVQTAALKEKQFLSGLRKLMASKPDGYYRIVTFVVTDQPFAFSENELDREEAADRYQSGLSALPNTDQFATPISSDHKIYVLIYEFENSKTDLTLLNPAMLDPYVHLDSMSISL